MYTRKIIICYHLVFTIICNDRIFRKKNYLEIVILIYFTLVSLAFTLFTILFSSKLVCYFFFFFDVIIYIFSFAIFISNEFRINILFIIYMYVCSVYFCTRCYLLNYWNLIIYSDFFLHVYLNSGQCQYNFFKWNYTFFFIHHSMHFLILYKEEVRRYLGRKMISLKDISILILSNL